MRCEVLRGMPAGTTGIDASGIGQLDSAGVLQLMRYATRNGIAHEALDFRQDHRALVSTIEDVADDRPKRKRDYGFAAALERLGYAVHRNGKEIVALVGFLGETLVKMMRLAHRAGIRDESRIPTPESPRRSATPAPSWANRIVEPARAMRRTRSLARTARRSTASPTTASASSARP
ncbi:hypothetical protein NB693_21160 [Pantoea ananatis]|uniref:hypothetical protein n=1 Tax=Pantoea ananas TaxID=553 RepID=UPI00221FB8C4|nr:hypothetical protein [Pantoea ananatis]